MSRDFLSRWSQRKREALREAERPQAPEAPPPAEPAGPEPAGADPDTITPEELESLPRPEEITAETDVTAFLRKGVPEVLRNAALRRAWALDPAIRDFVNPAREYAYDWNVPGGVPGAGPLLPTDDVAAMVRRVFGDPEPEAREGAEEASSAGSAPAVDEPVAREEEPPEPGPPALAAPAEPELQAVRLDRDKESEVVEPVRETAPAPPRRRHGGALPL